MSVARIRIDVTPDLGCRVSLGLLSFALFAHMLAADRLGSVLLFWWIGLWLKSGHTGFWAPASPAAA
jgi:hypothetical protein